MAQLWKPLRGNMLRRYEYGIAAATMILACTVVVIAYSQRNNISAGGVFVATMLAALVVPVDIAPRWPRALLLPVVLVWIVMELLPELGFQSPNQLIMLILTVPPLILAFTAMNRVDEHHPRMINPQLTVMFLGEIAYFLPYLLAAPVLRSAPLAGMGCLSIGCGSDVSGVNSAANVYALGGHFAGTFSVVLVIIVAIFGQWLMNRALHQKRKNEPQP